MKDYFAILIMGISVMVFIPAVGIFWLRFIDEVKEQFRK
jgi:hypothetical protein